MFSFWLVICRYIGLPMPPLAPSYVEKNGSTRQQRQEMAAVQRESRRSASFHGCAAEPRHQLKQRPRTQPDLLAGIRGRSFGGSAEAEPASRRVPSKVLVSVAVQRSMWPLHVMASAEWSVADLVAAAVGLYVKEGRRPALPCTDPSAFGLHYSQFSLESLDEKEKVMELGSRSFFLCPKSPATGATADSCFAAGADREASGKVQSWLGYVQLWPIHRYKLL